MDRPGDLEVQCPCFRVRSCPEKRATVRLYGNARPPMRSDTPSLPSSPGSTSTSLLPSPESHPNLVVRLSRSICAAGTTNSMRRAVLTSMAVDITRGMIWISSPLVPTTLWIQDGTMHLLRSIGLLFSPDFKRRRVFVESDGPSTLHATFQRIPLVINLGTEVE